MLTRNLPKMFTVFCMIIMLAGVSSCNRPGTPTGGAGPADQQQTQMQEQTRMQQQNQTCPMTNQTTRSQGNQTGSQY